MRRVIAATSNFTDTGDITTLANPEVVEKIREQVQSAKRAKGEAPPELSEADLHEIKTFGGE
jgi:acetyl-CoA synthetase